TRYETQRRPAGGTDGRHYRPPGHALHRPATRGTRTSATGRRFSTWPLQRRWAVWVQQLTASGKLRLMRRLAWRTIQIRPRDVPRAAKRPAIGGGCNME